MICDRQGCNLTGGFYVLVRFPGMRHETSLRLCAAHCREAWASGHVTRGDLPPPEAEPPVPPEKAPAPPPVEPEPAAEPPRPPRPAERLPPWAPRPTVADRIVRVLGEAPAPMQAAALRDLVKAADGAIRTALSRLVEDGTVTRHRVGRSRPTYSLRSTP